jgi:hypothetical protein
MVVAATALFPNLPEVLHRRRARQPVIPEAASHTIRLVGGGERRIRHAGEFAAEIADPVTAELVTSTRHKVSLKKVVEWMAHAGGASPRETAMKARVREG